MRWILVLVAVIVLALGAYGVVVRGAVADVPVVEIVSRTEYVPGDAGQVIVEVRYALSDQPAAATCYATVFYPNKTALFTEELMAAELHGTHNTGFTVPAIEGVYEYQTRCDLGTRNVTRSKAFHVSTGFRVLLEELANATQRKGVHSVVVK